MKKRKTDWFPASVNPVRDGLYQTRVSKFGDVLWSVWRDGAWHYACITAEVSVQKAEEGRMSFWQDRQWRGLTAPAK